MYEYRPNEKASKLSRNRLTGMGVFALAAVTLLVVLVGIGALAAFHGVFGLAWRTGFGGPLLQTFVDWASTFGFRHLGLGGVISVIATQSWICLASLYCLFDRDAFTQTFPFWRRPPAPVAALFPEGLFSRIQYACNFAFWGVIGLEAVRSWLLRLIAPPNGARLYWWHKGLSGAVNVFFWFILLPLRGLEQLLKIPASILACIGYLVVKAVSCCWRFTSRESVLSYADQESQSESVVESTREQEGAGVNDKKNEDYAQTNHGKGMVGQQQGDAASETQKKRFVQKETQAKKQRVASDSDTASEGSVEGSPSSQHASRSNKKTGDGGDKSPAGSDWMDHVPPDPIDPQESIYYVRPDDELLSPISTEWKSACQRTEEGTFKPMLMHAQLKSPTKPGGFDYCINARESVDKKVLQLTVYIDGKACICEMRGLPEMDDSNAMRWLLRYIEREEWVLTQRRGQESQTRQQLAEHQQHMERLQGIGEALQAEQRRFAADIADVKRMSEQHGARLDAYVEQRDKRSAEFTEIQTQFAETQSKMEQNGAQFAEAQEQVKQNAAELAAVRKMFNDYKASQEAVGAPPSAPSIPSPRRGPGFAFDARPPSGDSAAATVSYRADDAVIIDGEPLQK